MGQKSNIITLRHFKENILLNTNTKISLLSLLLLKRIKNLFNKRGVTVIKNNICITNNILYLTVQIFYNTKKLTQYKKIHTNKKIKKNVSLKKVFLKLIQKMRLHLIFIKFKNINNTINKKITKIFYQKLKKFSITLFDKRFNLFMDFIKINALFYENKISTNIYLFFLGKVFCFLHKKKHNQYTILLNTVFSLLINKLANIKSNLQGIKFILAGKLRGKTMASKTIINVGSVPIQTFNRIIDFEKVHTYTVYGAFGLKFWVYKKQ